ncbi:hypothetical protein [Litoribacillus peritrichatus]|uniref:Cytochrome c domain-containing protein n=1 Tax=Litoribacillus peritrichatus TaxID=718191 RepID=A0ABP7MKL1_9GAMM
MKNNLRTILAFTLGAFTCLLYAGESVTKQCEQCHAENAQASVLAPVLNGMPAWYIKDQIQNFQTGQRNSTSENAQFIDAAHQAHTFNSP